ncbi:MAG TPA: hypothetical protein DCQ31_16420, partial [Bacteroidales bacterium]|nr:hypothetical protein [Bacteroidales bacterium]
ETDSEPEYSYADYSLATGNMAENLPYFTVNYNAAKSFFENLTFSIPEFESKVAQNMVPGSFILKNKLVSFSISIKKEILNVRNVLGIIRGVDTTKTIVIGAHYDHLGIQNGRTYYGADDNASGTSGMLALAKVWKQSNNKPPCNLVFAAWTGEEIGLFGSEYFVHTLGANTNQILLYINMDMISRSAPEDSLQNQLSIGTRSQDVQLKQITNTGNTLLKQPFQLDLWDVNGYSGSDYASFTAKNIPVMTFFSGFQTDYHTPRDVYAKVDLKKMTEVLNLVNSALLLFMQQ